MPRRVVEHEGRTMDREHLTIITIFEETLSKEEVRKLTPFSKKHECLIKYGGRYEFAKKKA